MFNLYPIISRLIPATFADIKTPPLAKPEKPSFSPPSGAHIGEILDALAAVCVGVPGQVVALIHGQSRDATAFVVAQNKGEAENEGVRTFLTSMWSVAYDVSTSQGATEQVGPRSRMVSLIYHRTATKICFSIDRHWEKFKDLRGAYSSSSLDEALRKVECIRLYLGQETFEDDICQEIYVISRALESLCEFAWKSEEKWIHETIDEARNETAYRYLEKTFIYSRHIRNIWKFSSSVLPSTFTKPLTIHFARVPGMPEECFPSGAEAWTQLVSKVLADQSAEPQDGCIERVVAHAQKTTRASPRWRGQVHCECVLLAYVHMSPRPPPFGASPEGERNFLTVRMTNNRIGCSKLPCFCCTQYWWMYHNGSVARGRKGLAFTSSTHIWHGMHYCDSWAAPDLGNDASNAGAASKLIKAFGNAFLRLLQARRMAVRVGRRDAKTSQKQWDETLAWLKKRYPEQLERWKGTFRFI
ncbi:hypothetical protein BOTBODRAFT_38253 [Botryobasidium botryosum FD-172 SS1]|uniref:Uncharacterized protein n=1 Tax=Botryobasidium botryosum (strain FD-172 SS1) TaxID=930990 RepID=A0A067M835_BOTB1|nr:hypothetical protein BOTBODRAFT_38253 [Botryobasidium botryosum FD-172 SS1]